MTVVRSREKRISATDARVQFGEVVRAVTETQTDMVVERSGNPVIVVLSYEAYRRLKQTAGEDETQFDWWTTMVENARNYRESLDGRPMVDATDLIREMREERDAELIDRLR